MECAVAKMAGAQEDAEMLMEALSPVGIEVLVGKLRGKTVVLEVRAIIQEETRICRACGEASDDGGTRGDAAKMECTAVLLSGVSRTA